MAKPEGKPLYESFIQDYTNEERSEVIKQMLDILDQRNKQNIDQMLAILDQSSKSFSDKGKIIVPLLQKARMWYFPSMPEIIHENLWLLAKQKTEMTAVEEIEKIFIDYFDENKCENLKKMVLSWFDSPIFSRRRHIIEDALDVHIAGKFTLSIPALLPQVEGILSDKRGIKAGKLGSLLKNDITPSRIDFNKKNVFDALGVDILLSLADDPFLINKKEEGFGEDFTSERYQQWLKLHGVSGISLNRNAILHGIQIDYGTKANSLRVFLLLDFIHGIIENSRP